LSIAYLLEDGARLRNGRGADKRRSALRASTGGESLTSRKSLRIVYIRGYTQPERSMKAKGGERVEFLVAKWGNSLAVRLPADSARRLGVGEGDTLVGELASDSRLVLRAEGKPITGADVRRMREFVGRQKMTTPVVDELRRGTRY